MVEVVFPGKEFMIEKYIENKEQRAKSKEQRAKSKEQRAKSKDDRKDTSSYHHIITSKFWWLWYGYRWWVAVKGLFKMVNGKWLMVNG